MAAAAAVVAVAPVAVAADETGFSDVDTDNDHYDNILKLKNAGIVIGDNGKFKPYEEITRGQVAAILKKSLNLTVPTPIGPILTRYSDVSALDDEYAGQIAAVTKAGIFSGDNGKFNTYTNITREQMATVLVKAFNLDKIDAEEVALTDKKISDSHRANVQVLANLNITNQTKNFHAYEDISRDQFATMVVKSMEAAGVKDVKEIDVNSIGTSEAAAYSEDTDGGRDFEATVSEWNGSLAPEGTDVYVTISDNDLQGNVQLQNADGHTITAEDGDDRFNGNAENIFALETDKDGKINFTLIGEMNANAQPTVFLDNGEIEGELDAKDTQSIGETTSFGKAVFKNSTLKVLDKNGEKVEDVQVGEEGFFVYQLLDQNGKVNISLEHATTFEVKNIGLNEIEIEGQTIPRYESETIQIDSEDGKAILNMTAQGPAHVSVKASSSKDSIPDKNAMFEFKAGAELKEGMYYFGTGKLYNSDIDAKEITVRINGYPHKLAYDEADLYFNRNQTSIDTFEKKSMYASKYVFYKAKSDETDQLNVTRYLSVTEEPEEVIAPSNDIEITSLEAKSYFNPAVLGLNYKVSLKGTIALEDIADIKEVTVTLSSKETGDKKTESLYVNEYGMFMGSFIENNYDYLNGLVDEFTFASYDQITISYTNAKGEELSVTEDYEF
ncbi:S-layer homology domain-containing protein [Virgibacillus sp. FSP13]